MLLCRIKWRFGIFILTTTESWADIGFFYHCFRMKREWIPCFEKWYWNINVLSFQGTRANFSVVQAHSQGDRIKCFFFNFPDGVANCPAMSFVFVCWHILFWNIRNTNQLSWAINYRWSTTDVALLRSCSSLHILMMICQTPPSVAFA